MPSGFVNMSVLRPYLLGLALVLIEAPLPAPCQYPGQYPPGNGGVGIPVPRRHKKEEQAQLQSTSGMLRRILKDQVVVEADDHRILNFKRTAATHFLKMGSPIKPAELTPGDYIEIESSEDEEGFLTAVNVMWQQDGNAKDREHAAEPVETSLAKSSHDRAKDSAKGSGKESEAPESEQPSAKPASHTAAQPPPAADDQNPADLNAPAKDDVRSVQIDSDDQGPPVLRRGGKAARKEVEPVPPGSESGPPAPELSARN